MWRSSEAVRRDAFLFKSHPRVCVVVIKWTARCDDCRWYTSFQIRLLLFTIAFHWSLCKMMLKSGICSECWATSVLLPSCMNVIMHSNNVFRRSSLSAFYKTCLSSLNKSHEPSAGGKSWISGSYAWLMDYLTTLYQLKWETLQWTDTHSVLRVLVIFSTIQYFRINSVSEHGKWLNSW